MPGDVATPGEWRREVRRRRPARRAGTPSRQYVAGGVPLPWTTRRRGVTTARLARQRAAREAAIREALGIPADTDLRTWRDPLGYPLWFPGEPMPVVTRSGDGRTAWSNTPVLLPPPNRDWLSTETVRTPGPTWGWAVATSLVVLVLAAVLALVVLGVLP